MEDESMSDEWYYRDKPGGELFGPISLKDAEFAARRLSDRPDGIGQAEVLTTIGNRPGDPPQPGGTRFVVAFIYLLGKKTFAGRQAEIQSKKNKA